MSINSQKQTPEIHLPKRSSTDCRFPKIKPNQTFSGQIFFRGRIGRGKMNRERREEREGKGRRPFGVPPSGGLDASDPAHSDRLERLNNAGRIVSSGRYGAWGMVNKESRNAGRGDGNPDILFPAFLLSLFIIPQARQRLQFKLNGCKGGTPNGSIGTTDADTADPDEPDPTRSYRIGSDNM